MNRPACTSPDADALARLGGRARVVEPAQVRDVVLAHPQRALQQQRLGDRGVEPAVGGRLARQRGVGDRRVLERQPQRAVVVRVEVADPDAAVRRAARARRRRPPRRPSRAGSPRAARRDASSSSPVSRRWVGKIVSPGSLSETRHISTWRCGAVAADLLRVRARGLVAVVAVGDQQLGGRAAPPARRRSRPGRRRARADGSCRRRRSARRTAGRSSCGASGVQASPS